MDDLNITGDAKIIRKLGKIESIYDNELINNNLSQTRTFIVSISNRYSIDIGTLKKALKLWTQLHPLLQATIIREVDIQTKKSKLLLPKYYVYLNKSIDDYKNIELIDSSENFPWKALIENEVKTTLDYSHGPLWRMKILKDNTRPNDPNSTRYAFVLTTSHSISDGRNGFSLGVQFFDILIDDLENKNSYNYQIDTKSEFTMEDLIDRIQSKPDFKKIKEEIGLEMNRCRVPKNAGNKENGINCKFTSLFVNQRKLEKLIRAMKLNAPTAKFTSLMCVLISRAYKQACIKHKVDDISLDNIQLSAMVSLREKLGIDNLKMGVYATCLNCIVDLNKAENDFWNLVDSNSIQFHRRLENNEEFLTLESLGCSWINLINSNYDFVNHSPINFLLSNIGVMKNSSNENVLQIKEHYLALPCLETRFGPFLFFGLSTIDNNLCLAISYSEKLFTNEFINELKETFLVQIDKIIQ